MKNKIKQITLSIFAILGSYANTQDLIKYEQQVIPLIKEETSLQFKRNYVADIPSESYLGKMGWFKITRDHQDATMYVTPHDNILIQKRSGSPVLLNSYDTLMGTKNEIKDGKNIEMRKELSISTYDVRTPEVAWRYAPFMQASRNEYRFSNPVPLKAVFQNLIDKRDSLWNGYVSSLANTLEASKLNIKPLIKPKSGEQLTQEQKDENQKITEENQRQEKRNRYALSYNLARLEQRRQQAGLELPDLQHEKLRSLENKRQEALKALDQFDFSTPYNYYQHHTRLILDSKVDNYNYYFDDENNVFAEIKLVDDKCYVQTLKFHPILYSNIFEACKIVANEMKDWNKEENSNKT